MARTRSTTRLNWNDAATQADVRRQAIAQLNLAGGMLVAQVKRNISTSSRGSGPSRPGEYPHADTGALRNSIFYRVDASALTVTVGTTLKYGLYLEFGTQGGRTMIAAPGKVFSWVDPKTGARRFSRKVTLGPIKPRPFLRRTMTEMASRLRTVLAGDTGRVRVG
jgi:hypothetical protein